MKTSAAEIIREYGPFPGVDRVNGVTFDGRHVWIASGDRLIAIDPDTGETVRSIDVASHAGTAFDGVHLWQIAEDLIQKIHPATGEVLASIPAPGGGGDSGLAWAEGTLWVGQHRGRKIHQVDPGTGTILRTIESDRIVTGVTWVDDELWHGTWEGDESEVRHVDARTGEVFERLEMPPDTGVSGLESDGHDRFFCGSGGGGTVRIVRRPRRHAAAGDGPGIAAGRGGQVAAAARSGAAPASFVTVRPLLQPSQPAADHYRGKYFAPVSIPPRLIRRWRERAFRPKTLGALVMSAFPAIGRPTFRRTVMTRDGLLSFAQLV